MNILIKKIILIKIKVIKIKFAKNVDIKGILDVKKIVLFASILKKKPGLAFGFTTIGLFLGTAPIFFVSIPSIYVNIIMITVLSVMCSISLGIITKKENRSWK